MAKSRDWGSTAWAGVLIAVEGWPRASCLASLGRGFLDITLTLCLAGAWRG